MTTLLIALLAQAAAAQSAGRTQPDTKAPSEIVAAAPARDWTEIPPRDLIVMTLAPDAKGAPRRVTIQLMPAPFSKGWIGNIRTLAAAHWWDGLSVNRVQDNYVAQWGDASGEDPKAAKALPAGLKSVPEAEYTSRFWCGGHVCPPAPPVGKMRRYLRSEYGEDTFVRGWPVSTRTGIQEVWPVHCYGMVGVGRNLSPDTGTGAELYTVIGHAPRHLDRNIALVGRVIEGIEHLSSLPRGTEALGFYKTATERTPIVSIRLASDLPATDQPRFEYLSTESGSFAAYAEARANRRDAFFNVPAGGADICNIPVPVRRVK